MARKHRHWKKTETAHEETENIKTVTLSLNAAIAIVMKNHCLEVKFKANNSSPF